MGKLTIQELYSSPIRTVCVVFGSLFNDIEVRKYDTEGNVLSEKERVPISFSDKSAYGLWLEQKMRLPSGTTEIGNKFPRISYTINGMSIDTQRLANVNVKRKRMITENDITYMKSVRNIIPYQFDFTLSIWSKDMNTMLQILEQILPYFKPEIAVRVKENSDMRLINDYKIVLTGVQKDDNFLEGFDNNRIITYDLSFSVNASIIEPVNNVSPITEVIVDLNNQNNIEFLEEKNCCYA